MATTSPAARRAGALLLSLVLVLPAAACSSDGGGDDAGGDDGGAVQIAGGPQIAGGEGGEGGSAGTIPLEEEEGGGIQELGSALQIFNACVTDEGWEFQGRPDPESDDPVLSDPDYLAAMSRCANESKILEAFDALEAQQAALTPEEIEAQNAVILEVQACLRGKGWEWGDLPRADNGALNVFANPPQPPDDTSVMDIFSHPDLVACQEQIAADTEDDEAAG